MPSKKYSYHDPVPLITTNSSLFSPALTKYYLFTSKCTVNVFVIGHCCAKVAQPIILSGLKLLFKLNFLWFTKALYVHRCIIWNLSLVICVRYSGSSTQPTDPAPDYAQIYFPAQDARYCFLLFSKLQYWMPNTRVIESPTRRVGESGIPRFASRPTRRVGESFFDYEYLRKFEAEIGTARNVV